MRTVAWREIRSAARRPVTYWGRSAAGAIGALVLMSLGFAEPRTIFMSGVVLAFVLCLLEGVRLASASIVDERNEGTLGLLLLTRLRSEELLAGKLLALGFFSLQTLLAITPVLAISSTLGGVSAGEMARSALGLAQSLLVALTCGLVVSAHSRTSTRAMVWTFILLIGGGILLNSKWRPSGGWFGFVYNSLNPFTPILTISDLRYSVFKTEYWICMGLTVTVVFLTLRSTSRLVAANFSLEEATARMPQGDGEERPWIGPVKASKPCAQWFSGNPIEWLTLRNLGCTRRLRRAIPVIGTILFSAAILMIDFQGFVWGLLALVVFGFIYSVSSVQTFARARQSGEIELWLTTPLTVKEIYKGHMAAIRRVFLWPGLILIGTWGAMFFRLIIYKFISGAIPGGPTPPGFSQVNPQVTIFYIFISMMLAFLALLFVLPYVGMWMALKSKTPAQAATRTFLLMVVFPWFVFVIPKALLFVAVGMVAGHYVQRNLKNFATSQTRAR